MCLGELAEVTHVTGHGSAEVRADGRRQEVSLLALEEPVAPGDWVLIHSGFALSRLTENDVHEAKLIRSGALKDIP
jgi:hydrogenase expression/formation protein HypC